MNIDLSSYRGLINSLQVVLIAVSDLIFLSEGENNRDLFQRREDYGDLEGMKQTIKVGGLTNPPIIMVDEGEEGRFRVVEGNRRAQALTELLSEGVMVSDSGQPLQKIKCYLKKNPQQLSEIIGGEWEALNPGASDEEKEGVKREVKRLIEQEMERDSVVRNSVRKNFTPIEMARAAQSQIEGGMGTEELASYFGIAESTLKGYLRLLEKEGEAPEVIKAAEEGDLPISTAELLTNLKVSTKEGKELQDELLEKALEGELTGAEVKDKINEAHKVSLEEGGEGVKKSHRETKKKVSKKGDGVKGRERILKEIEDLGKAKAQLEEAEDRSADEENFIADLSSAIIALQWVVNEGGNLLDQLATGGGLE